MEGGEKKKKQGSLIVKLRLIKRYKNLLWAELSGHFACKHAVHMVHVSGTQLVKSHSGGTF